MCLYLQADGQVDPAAEGRADGARVKAEVFEEFGEGVCERHPGPLLRHHHAGPHPGQIKTPSLDDRREEGGKIRAHGGLRDSGVCFMLLTQRVCGVCCVSVEK